MNQILYTIFHSFNSFNQTALAAGRCFLNGQEVPCENIGFGLNGLIGLGAGAAVFMGIIFLISLALFIFWVLMLVHAISKPIDSKPIWIILLAITGLLGAIVYYFAVKREFDKRSVTQVSPSSSSSSPPTSSTP